MNYADPIHFFRLFRVVFFFLFFCLRSNRGWLEEYPGSDDEEEFLDPVHKALVELETFFKAKEKEMGLPNWQTRRIGLWPCNDGQTPGIYGGDWRIVNVQMANYFFSLFMFCD